MFPFYKGPYSMNSFAPIPVWNNHAPTPLPAPRPPPPAHTADHHPVSAHNSPAPTCHLPGFRTKHHWRAQQPAVAIFEASKEVHINTYSHRLVSIEPVALQEVCQYRPEGLNPLLTIECMTWCAPPGNMCELWSGVSPEIQGFMKGVRTARKAIKHAVDATVAHLLQGHDAALLEVCCVQGTHRSVAVAELIGEKLREMGIDTYVTHVHRVRKPRDAY